MKILHLISQHPESTGSGFYLQNLIRQAAAAGHQNFLIAGMTGERIPRLPGIDPDHCCFVRFDEGELNFAVPGISPMTRKSPVCCWPPPWIGGRARAVHVELRQGGSAKL